MTTGLIGTVRTMSTTYGRGAVTKPTTGGPGAVRTADGSGVAVVGRRGGSAAGRDRSTR
ncbi:MULTISPECIES: hypothetical protein [Micromonospora]|uniref:hypothetical protein n=1 Tax=Micromonospora TaxID=1873 RepID=UPI001EE8233C|nr:MULTISPECIES: hypothetical protein [Micromonospora]MCG5449588.1 hypothetical protein [Micromonospora hortensis]MCX5115613.1 hypothetical protein [Micromonospora sp. NBC_00362]